MAGASWFIGRHALGVEKLSQSTQRRQHIKEKKEWRPQLLWKLQLIVDFGSGMHGLECMPGANNDLNILDRSIV